METIPTRWLFILLLVTAVAGLGGCALAAVDPSDVLLLVSTEAPPGQGDQSSILVSLATSGERGDLPKLLRKRPDLASALATAVAPQVESQARGFAGIHVAASFKIVGSATEGPEVWLFAHESLATFSVGGGRLIEEGGMSAPVRIRLSVDSLQPIAIDEPLDGSAYGPSIGKMMPEWASERAAAIQWDGEALRAAAGRWAQRKGRLAELISLSKPAHSDPHSHEPNVYSLDAIQPDIHGFEVGEVTLSKSDSTPNLDALEKVSSSPDGRFDCYVSLNGWNGVVVHDSRFERWLGVTGPGLGILIDDIAWVGDSLVFDKVDVGFSEPRPAQMTIIHVELDLSGPAIERVVPFGPHTGNWH